MGNLKGVGLTLRSWSQVRLVETLRRRDSIGCLLLREWASGRVGKCERGGREPNGRAGRPRRGEGQESNGFFGDLTVFGRERLLNRSKALESGSSPDGVCFAGPKPSLLVARLSVLRWRLGLGSASRHGACWFAGGFL